MRSYCKEPTQNRFYSVDVSDGTGDPLPLSDVKDYLRVTFDDDDASISALIKQSIQSIEKYCSISIYTRTITVDADIYFETELPYGPVISLTSASYFDGTTYQAITGASVMGGAFKRYRTTNTSRQQIIYVAGNYLPDSLKLAVLNEVAFRYENKGDNVNRYASQNVGASEGAQTLAMPYRRFLWL